MNAKATHTAPETTPAVPAEQAPITRAYVEEGLADLRQSLAGLLESVDRRAEMRGGALVHVEHADTPHTVGTYAELALRLGADVDDVATAMVHRALKTVMR